MSSCFAPHFSILILLLTLTPSLSSDQQHSCCIRKVQPTRNFSPFFFSFANNQSFSPPPAPSFFISKLSHDDRIYSATEHGHLFFFKLGTQQKNQGTLWSTCLPNDEGGREERGEHPPPEPLLKSTNHSIVVAQSALLSCQCRRRGHRDEWHTG